MFAKVFKEHIGFDALVAQLVKEGKTQAQAEALAASIGRKKYGKKQFQAMAAKSEVSVQKDPEKTQYGSFMEACMTDPKHKSKFTADGQLVAVCLSMAKQHGLMYKRVGKADIGEITLKGAPLGNKNAAGPHTRHGGVHTDDPDSPNYAPHVEGKAHFSDLGFKEHPNWSSGSTLLAKGADVHKNVMARLKKEGWGRVNEGKSSDWYVHPTKDLAVSVEKLTRGVGAGHTAISFMEGSYHRDFATFPQKKGDVSSSVLKGDFEGHPFRGNQHVDAARPASAGMRIESGPQAGIPALFVMQVGAHGAAPTGRGSLAEKVSPLPSWRHPEMSASLHGGLLSSVGRAVTKACKKKLKAVKSGWGTDLGIK